MELGPVEGSRTVEPVSVSRSASDVTPAFAVEGSGRMQDDSYGGDAMGSDRGMEEDDAVEGDETESEQNELGIFKQVNLFA
jgi:hypothetical protein